VHTNAQSFHSYKILSKYEKRWVLGHPFIAKKTFRVTQAVIHICDSIKKDSVFTGNGNGDQLDAFRHALWMAMLCQYIKPGKAYKLGQAHEFGNRLQFKNNEKEDGEVPDSMSIAMDIINNQIGIEMGIRHNSEYKKINKEKLVKEIIAEIKKGNLRILLKDKSGNYYNCDYKPIDLKTYTGVWALPKCLVRSNTIQE
jgi:hypothetical protein